MRPHHTLRFTLPVLTALLLVTFSTVSATPHFNPPSFNPSSFSPSPSAGASATPLQNSSPSASHLAPGTGIYPLPDERPVLVVGIMVDQLRPDYISRFWDKLSEGGFKRLINEGFTFTNKHFNYMPTATGPGHASVYTGTTPSYHGAMGNSWYVRDLDRSINVIEVPGYEGVGSEPGYDGNKGPSNLLTTTIGDELRLHTNLRSKVIGISRKDRGAILPGGHLGDAYWYEGSTGNFVTSTYYMEELPEWLQEFNARNLAQEYLSQPWETLLPIEEYVESMEDDNPYESLHADQDAPVFPHDLPRRVEEHGAGPGLLSGTPFGDKLLLELAFAAMEGESLGRNGTTDMLNISFSATDGVGHSYGPASIEIQDHIMRLDRYVEELLNHLDSEYGMENILLFVTSDHGVTHVPDYLTDLGIPGGRRPLSDELDNLRSFMTETWGEDLFLAFSNYQIFLNRERIEQLELDLGQVQKQVARYMLGIDGVAGTLTAEELIAGDFTRGVPMRAQNGFNQKRSGDVVIWLEPHITTSSSSRGTTHGSPWIYDTHAPGFWIGGLVPPGSSSHPVTVTDIAPTVATFLQIPFPSGTTGSPLNDLMQDGAR